MVVSMVIDDYRNSIYRQIYTFDMEVIDKY